MKDTIYLVVSASGVERLTKRPPSLCRHEAAIKLTVTVPDGCFRSWSFGAAIDIPEDRVIQPEIEVQIDEVPQQDEA